MFNIQELTVIGQAINSLDIKGSDAIYIAQLLNKIQTIGDKLNKEAEKKENGKQEIISKTK
tara:strand:+ start:470 stop:652 length:183 start_codon:yes stop_codon:yes gene_type:complete